MQRFHFHNPGARWFVVTLTAVLCSATIAAAVDHVTLSRAGERLQVSGDVLAEAQDGGLLLLAPDGVLWAVQPDELINHRSDSEKFALLERKALAAKVLAELPAGFETHDTAHYLIVHNTSKPYAQWCGALYERLYRAFFNYWTRRGFKPTDPPAPLVALVFDDKHSYAYYAKDELGEAVESIIGYYSLRTNRITSYDLTGVEQLAGAAGRGTTAAHVNRILAQADADRTVATIIHEATHQLAFNCGLHQRYADVPLWLSEGIAVYFETPDLQSTQGWRTIGAVNRARLVRFRDYARRRPPDSIETLIATDDRLRGGAAALDAYAEAWALTFYLLRTQPREYVEYLQLLAEKRPLFYDEPQQRVAEFKKIFGDDLDTLDADFRRQMSRLRP